MKRKEALFAFLLLFIFAQSRAQAMCGVCGADGNKAKAGESAVSSFDRAKSEAKMVEGVKEISYEQLKDISKNEKDVKLVDVLGADSFAEGHIEGSISLPVNDINTQTSEKIFKKTDKIIVYCASFHCPASTEAAKKLQALGYENVVDYKGGLDDWQKRGEKLVK